MPTKTMSNYIDYLGKWLEEELNYRGAETFIFGNSGGVDSAVIAHLLAKFFPQQSLALMMPCLSNPQDLNDAQIVIDQTQLPSHTVDLSATHHQLMEAIGDQYNRVEGDDERQRVMIGNTSARLRMTTLYTIAQTRNGIVVGTDNAVEWYTGYFTKFGDGGVDIIPLFSLNKDDVYEMAHLLGVDQTIIDKKPSAGLWEAQTDEGEMGTTYAMLNRHLLGLDVPEKDRERIAYWHERSHHKRHMPRTPNPYRPIIAE